ncbi:molybdenum cofactor guanylyltransferase [Tundrisphaera sp. TA3]|uniref:molybdenum cofactor guanylyltransferase n=1 Tax=Tundrisphaera sp. TA3 TaxID=3435775 RepID=UPI003EBEF4ED
MSIGGVILCGGRARRMGNDKASLRFGPEMLLQRVVRLVAASAGPIVVVAAAAQDLPPLPRGVRVVRDPVPDLGPLPGLAAGCRALPPETSLAYATGTDAPFLHPGWIEHLAALIGDRDAAVVHAGGFPHPLAALYRVAAVLPAMDGLMREGRSRLRDIIDVLDTLKLPAEAMREVDPDLATLRNLNTPEDYREAEAEAGFGPAGRTDGPIP